MLLLQKEGGNPQQCIDVVDCESWLVHAQTMTPGICQEVVSYFTEISILDLGFY